MTFPRNILPTLLIVFVACNVHADQYAGLQLSARDISTLAALKVTPEYVQEMRSYFPDISAREITNLYALKVSPHYLKDMRSHFPNMDVRDVTNLYALKVPADYVKDMRAYFPKISIREITNLYALKVPPDYVKQIHDLGYSDISTREITNFYALKVQPDYIKQMRESGQPIGTGEHIHVPEIHVPEINVSEIHIPEIHIQTPAVPPVAPSPHGNHFLVFKFSHWRSIFSALGVVLLMGGGGYYLYTRRNVTPVRENIDTRIAEFEGRVNDLQDILLSIDNRLDRRLRRS